MNKRRRWLAEICDAHVPGHMRDVNISPDDAAGRANEGADACLRYTAGDCRASPRALVSALLAEPLITVVSNAADAIGRLPAIRGRGDGGDFTYGL